MDAKLKEKIEKMSEERLNSIVENSELYNTDVVEAAKARIEEIKQLSILSEKYKAKIEALSIEEINQILKEPDLYNPDVVALARNYKNSQATKSIDFSNVPQEAKNSLSKMSAEQLLDMLTAKEGMLSSDVVSYTKYLISQKMDTEDNTKTESTSEVKELDAELESSDIPSGVNEVSFPECSYSMWKKFFSLIYRTIKTDLSFKDDKIVITKGTGFSKPKKFAKTEIMYEDISSVRVRRKVDTTNLLLAVFGFIGALITQAWAALIVVALVIWWGLTAVATISYNNDMCEYDIPTEFKSDAEDAKEKIETALKQYKAIG